MPQSRRDNYFLVLPNSSGGVSGIDEMFGDNTRGPDGKFAANGYEVRLKSIVSMEDGCVNLIYDLWFALKGT